MIEHMFGSSGVRSQSEEQVAVLALVEAAGSEWEWHRIADTVTDVGSALRIVRGEWSGFEGQSAHDLHEIVERTRPDLGKLRELIDRQLTLGVRLTTVLDPDYPANLREIYNRPPFLFVRGSLSAADSRAICVVGARGASPAGLDQARRLAGGLARSGVTVLSGMARGIDTAAHRAALAVGGRTVAVMGTGMDHRYPPENSLLADEIERSGALVSQFWPTAPPRPFSFPMRNIVMSGLGRGTVVIEASSTSGAKGQARIALEHGKLVFLVRSLVLAEDWAKRYAAQRGAIVIDDVDEVVDWLVRQSDAGADAQLKLG